MNTVIVPVDFNETSVHAARYGAEMLKGHPGVNMILYNHYEDEKDAAVVEEKLAALKVELLNGSDLNIEILTQMGSDFVDDFERALRHRKADLAIMGINERNMLAQVFKTSRAVKMADTKACPVLIVPEEASFTPIANVMLASNFKDTRNATPSVPIKDFLSIFNPNLHIVNVDPEHFVAITEAYEKEKRELAAMFSEYDPEFYFLRLYDVDEALNLFAEEKGIDLIVSIMHNHNFIEKVLKRSHVAKLSYQSKIPVLIVHE